MTRRRLPRSEVSHAVVGGRESRDKDAESAVRAWEKILTREILGAADLPVALAAIRAKYGDGWLANVLRDTWCAEHDYAEHPIERPHGWTNWRVFRPAAVAKTIGCHVFASPSFRHDWWALIEELRAIRAAPARMFSSRNKRTHTSRLKASTQSFLAAVLSSPPGAPKNPERARELEEARQVRAELERMRSDDLSGANAQAFVGSELGLESDAARRLVAASRLDTLARLVAISRSEPHLKGKLDQLQLAEDSLRHFPSLGKKDTRL